MEKDVARKEGEEESNKSSAAKKRRTKTHFQHSQHTNIDTCISSCESCAENFNIELLQIHIIKTEEALANY